MQGYYAGSGLMISVLSLDIKAICEKFLANTVIEKYEIELK
jgi:phosphoribosylformylglycinamidine (FGAM) synthase PurS component